MADEVKSEEEMVEAVKDIHTWVDEVANNVIKVYLIVFVTVGMGYCMTNYVGKDKGVDPNLVYGFFAGIITTIFPAYFAFKSKKDKETPK